MKSLQTTLFVLLLQLTQGLSATSVPAQALLYINDLRQQAGMAPFTRDLTLQKAAQQHADYLFVHRKWGHDQMPGTQGFVGKTPLERMLNAGYSSRHNSENVSSHSGRASPVKSVNGLMSAIYHRFGFLTFDFDEMGIGYQSDEAFHTFVYNMGNSQKSALCSANEEQIRQGQYTFKVCADPQKKIRSEVFARALSDAQMKNAEFVLWPPSKGINVPPAFYDEAPDPLPEYDVSGYPVSIQFNPAFYVRMPPKVVRFELYKASSNEVVELIARFDHNTDINQKFTQYEHAIFPKHRLDWDSVYRVEVDYLLDMKNKQSVTWLFRTAGFDQPLYVVNGGELINERAGAFVVYSPPVSRLDGKSEYQVSYRGFEDIEVVILDAHTLIIKPIGHSGSASFDFHGKQFTVVK